MWGEDWGVMIWTATTAVPTLGSLGLVFLAGGLLGAGLARLRGTQARRVLVSASVLLLALAPLVAVADIILPNTFQNGTIADADEVNANFQAILDETARWHFSPTATGTHPIPHAVIEQLCEDQDGCEVIATWAPIDDFPNGASTRLIVTPQPGFGVSFWRTHGGDSGIDGDGTPQAALLLGGCSLLDRESDSDDAAVGWGVAGDADCTMAIGE